MKPVARERARAGRRGRRGRAREIARIAHSAVGSHGCAAYLHLLSPLSSLLHQGDGPGPAARSTPVVVPPRTRVCSSFNFSLFLSFFLYTSVSRTLIVSRSPSHSRSLHPTIRLLLSSTSFLPLALSPTRVSSRTTGRTSNLGARIYARINHRGKRSREERGSKRAQRANGRI